MSGAGQAGTVYLLHFDRPYKHARHYLGWAAAGHLDSRIAAHRGGQGARRLMAVIEAAGIGFRLARTWTGSRARERQIKRRRLTVLPAVRRQAPGRCLVSARVRRGAMWALAAGVAAIAAIVSYSHIYDLGRAHGGTGVAARLLPLSVDMLILVGELMLLHEADAKGQRFTLGWLLVWSGILATLAANVAYGAQFGWLGALIWGWPAYSFILAAGGMVAVVKRGEDAGAAGHGAPALPAVPAPDALPAPIPTDAQSAALTALKATTAAGNPLSGRQLETRFGLTRTEAAKVRELAAPPPSLNGNGGSPS